MPAVAAGRFTFGTLVRIAFVVAAVLLSVASAGAQSTPPAPQGTALNEAAVLSELEAALERAALQPDASRRSLRQAGERVLNESLREWQRGLLETAVTPQQRAEVRVRLMHEERRLRGLLRSAVAERTPRLTAASRGSTGVRDQRAVQASDTAPFPLGTGVLTGWVSGPSGPLNTGAVIVYDVDGISIGWPPIMPDGKWTMSGLAAGTYYVKTENRSGLVDQVWNAQPCSFLFPDLATDCAATPIVLADGATQAGISFNLAAGGRIAGTVTASAGSAPIPGVLVQIFDAQGRTRSEATSASDGTYFSDQAFPSGSYFVRTGSWNAAAPGYLDEGYNNHACEPTCSPAQLDPVAVTSPATTSQIDFALDPAAGISGIVKADDTGLPVSGAWVYAYTDTGSYLEGTQSGSDGRYALGGLPAGKVKAYASSSTYLSEIYDDVPCMGWCDMTSGGTAIPVTVGSIVPSINFSLAKGGSISGKVTRSDTGAALSSIPVVAWHDAGQGADQVRLTYTAPDGTFTLTALPAGGFYVSTAAYEERRNFVDQIYPNVPCLTCGTYWMYWNVDFRRGTPVPVTAGTDTPGINFSLDPGAQISGSVTRAGTGTPVTGEMDAYSWPGGQSAGWVTLSGGNYSFGGLPAGKYAVGAWSSSGEVSAYYNGATDWYAATPVTVSTGGSATGINFELAAGGRVGGTVTRADNGQPVSGAVVSFYSSGRSMGYGRTDNSGAYVTQEGLPTGRYNAFASASGLQPMLYRSIGCMSQFVDCGAGDLVSVTSPGTTSGVDFALPAGGTISGTVTDATTGSPVPNASVYARIVSSAGRSSSRYAYAASGTYTLQGLPPGGYYLTASASGYGQQLFQGIACADCDVRTGRRVDVKAGATTTGVNFALPKGGVIAGRVTSAATGSGLPATVVAYNTSGSWFESNTAGASGSYSINNLPAGSYYVVAEGGAVGHSDVLYNNRACAGGSCTVTTGTAVAVAAGSTTSGIDFSLPAAGSITGFVRDSQGNPIWGGTVGDLNGGASSTQVDGYYRIDGLPPGDRFVVASADGFVSRVYNQAPWAGETPPPGATAVPVTAGHTTTGIDFSLSRGASISGTVRAGGQPVGGASVFIAKSDVTNELDYASTGADGTYRVAGLFPPGTYHAWVEKNGFTPQLYSGKNCTTGSCSHAPGTAITVTGTTSVTGIDFDIAPATLKFFTLTPCRLLDTRRENGLEGGPALAGQGDRTFPGAGVCGVPFDAKALAINLTVTGATGGGWLSLHAGRSVLPLASNVNYFPGQTRANNAVLPLNGTGEYAIYCGQGSGTTHTVVDVTGYFK